MILATCLVLKAQRVIGYGDFSDGNIEIGPNLLTNKWLCTIKSWSFHFSPKSGCDKSCFSEEKAFVSHVFTYAQFCLDLTHLGRLLFISTCSRHFSRYRWRRIWEYCGCIFWAFLWTNQPEFIFERRLDHMRPETDSSNTYRSWGLVQYLPWLQPLDFGLPLI